MVTKFSVFSTVEKYRIVLECGTQKMGESEIKRLSQSHTEETTIVPW